MAIPAFVPSEIPPSDSGHAVHEYMIAMPSDGAELGYEGAFPFLTPAPASEGGDG